MRRPLLPMIALVLGLGAVPVSAQWPPTEFENLRVLPDTIAPQALIALMGNFTRALGVRCTHCHVGEERQPLSTYDFPSDDRLNKRKAREMLRMVAAINAQYLTELEERADPPVRVQCVTCHGGRTTPRELDQVLILAYRAGGVDSTLAAYRGLRDRYYGRSAYDFGSVPLTVVADSIGLGGLADAVTVLALNVEMNPTSAFAKRQHGVAAVLLAFRTGGVEAGVARYRTLHADYGAGAFPEFSLNGLGYTMLGANMPVEAVAVFQLMTEAFPESANAFDSLGEGYAAAGDVANAIASYEHSLELDGQNDNAREKLRELRARR